MDIPDMYRDLNDRNTEVNLEKLLGKLYEMVMKLRSRYDTDALSLLSYQIEKGSREAAGLEMNELNAMLAWAPEKLAEINRFLEEAGGAEVESIASNQVGEAGSSGTGGAGVNMGIGSSTNNPDQASHHVGTDVTLINDQALAWFLNMVNQSSNVAESSTGAGQD